MNKERRKQIDALVTKLEDIKSDLESIQQDEQDFYDNMPESIQAGEKGEAASTAADALQCAIDDLDGVLTQLQEAIS